MKNFEKWWEENNYELGFFGGKVGRMVSKWAWKAALIWIRKQTLKSCNHHHCSFYIDFFMIAEIIDKEIK